MERSYLWAEQGDTLSFMLASLAVCQYEDTDGWIIIQYDEDGEPHRLGKTVFKSKKLAMTFAETHLTDEAHQLPLLERAPAIDFELLVASYVLAFITASAFSLVIDSSIFLVTVTILLTIVTNAAALGESPSPDKAPEDEP